MKIIPFILIFASLLLLACSRGEIPPRVFFEVETIMPNDKDGELEEIELIGNLILEEGISDAVQVGFLYSNTNDSLSFKHIENVKEVFADRRSDKINGFEFYRTIVDFDLKKPLYVVAFAILEIDGTRRIEGGIQTFVPGNDLLMQVKKATVENRTVFLETAVFNLEFLYDAKAKQHGHVYDILSENDDPRIDGEHKGFSERSDLDDDGVFLDIITELESNTTYVIRPYITLVSGAIIHGDAFHFRIRDTWKKLGNLEMGGIKEPLFTKIQTTQRAFFGLGCGLPFCEGIDGLTQVWEFDPTKNPNVQIVSDAMQEVGLLGREGGTAFAIGESIYLGFGKISFFGAVSELGDFWQFNPNKPSERWIGIGAPDNLKRSHAVAFTIGNKGYVGLGKLSVPNTGEIVNDIIFKNDFYEFDPSKIDSGENPWRQLSDLLLINNENNSIDIGRHEAIAFSLNGMGYVATGSNNGLSLGDFWKFDPNRNNGLGEWIFMENFPVDLRTGATSFVIEENNKAYICTGERFNNIYYTDIWEFDGITEVWTKRTNFPGVGRRNAIGFSINGKGYIISGWRRIGTNTGVVTEILPDIWEYTPEEN